MDPLDNSVANIKESNGMEEVLVEANTGNSPKQKDQEQEQEQELRDEEISNVVAAEEYLEREKITLLPYEKQMFIDLVYSDGLTVCAKGLHYDRVLLNILKVYSDPGNLVLIINSSDWEEEYYKSKLERQYVREVSSSVAERARIYLEGGIQFVSTRIVVVDMLKNRIPLELISGIVVMRAHTIIESCQEAFALRLYRQRNKTGFIKAFSNSAEAFTIGYGHIERTMRNLFVRDLFIWPRFHANVQASLKAYGSKTIELHVPMSIKMTLLQTHILDIMNYLVREMKRINRCVDLDEITVENCVTKKFHRILQAQLDCIWHQLNAQTKLIVADLKILRNLMLSIIYNDAVSSYALTKRYRTTEYTLSNSGWTLLDAAEQIFKLSKERVFNDNEEFDPEPCPKWKYLAQILQHEIPADMRRRCKANQSCGAAAAAAATKVLILCQDARTCYQLKQFLTQSGERYLLFAAMKNEIPVGKLAKSYGHVIGSEHELDAILLSQGSTTQCKKKKVANNAATEIDAAQQLNDNDNELTALLKDGDENGNMGGNCFQESYMLTMTQTQINGKATDRSFYEGNDNDNDNDSNDDETASNSLNTSIIFEPFPELNNLDITTAITTVESGQQPLICLHAFKTEREGSMALDRILMEIQPQYVVMYHSSITAIRQLEIYEARQHRPVAERATVFFLMHAQTVEEQSYLTSLRREKQAFELIIDTKSKMVIPEYQDGKTDEAFILYKSYIDPELAGTSNETTRKAGGQALLRSDGAGDSSLTSKVVVDMREFRSDLPCLLHKRGIEIIPVTITIGDYILTPEICVERKSISDLIGSLNSGRLYNQCIQMQRFYAKPILLIEFDQNKPFHLQGKYMLSHSMATTNSDIVQKLQLLTLHFPRLRLIWSPSPYATAQLFEELKTGKDEPDGKVAATIGSDEVGGGIYDDLKFNANIYDFLLRLPGITTRNIQKIMRHGGSLKQLLKLTETELGDLLESQANGKLLWNILHVMHLPDKDQNSSSSSSMAAINRGSTRKNLPSHLRFPREMLAAKRGK